jgi:hypothetical protein
VKSSWRDWATAGHAACFAVVLIVLAGELVEPPIIRRVVEAIAGLVAIMGLVLG